MNRASLAAFTAVVISAVAAAIGADMPPTSAPAPGGATIRGLLSATSLDLQKPDLSRAVVYLDSDPALDKDPPPAAPAVVAQRDKKFVPDLAVIAQNTAVEFPNEDPFDHNVFSRSKAAPAFDLGRYPKGMSNRVTFSKVGVVQVFCNIHPSMRAVIVVTPNRYFARADGKGNFSITGVPAGRYTLVAWQERCDDARKEIDVAANAAVDVALALKESRQGIMANEGLDRRDSYGLERGLGVKQEKLNLPVVNNVHPTASTTAPCCAN